VQLAASHAVYEVIHEMRLELSMNKT